MRNRYLFAHLHILSDDIQYISAARRNLKSGLHIGRRSVQYIMDDGMRLYDTVGATNA